MIMLLRTLSGYDTSDVKEFLIDSAEDKANLPTSNLKTEHECCSPGSVAYTPDLATMFMLGNDDVWHEI